ncbi:dynein regulatory complex subunit 3 isoform X1 [Drosophila mojavensis]|uniref:dynein regulatory complex subunit 3 isoform X1 n=2 Tax=Drosophila mojavensis TaxID=7230 RepID=UPI00017C8B70|nr:dynein regulatory complex subunit 3 isoform X1 [Drosophila mojavensis]
MDEETQSPTAERNKSFLEEVNFPEPGIINLDMIRSSYLEEGQHGETRRLHQLEPVILDRIKTLRLEFKNILRIDHLWVLPNLTKLCLNCNKIEVIEHIGMLTALKELNLSFNYITKIENLETLVNLEVLSLFGNRITRIENLETLDKLVILSIGNNLINVLDGIDRLRFVNSLKVLNLEGNPIAKLPDFPLSQYVTAILPQLNYYEYVFIKDEVREAAQKRFYRELREIEAKQEKEIHDRETEARELAEAERLASSFVEHLDRQQLYETMWRGDDDGRVLMLIGAPAQELAEDYEKDVYELTQKIYKLGLERFNERDADIKDFLSCLEEGRQEFQCLGQKHIEEFMQYRDKTFEEASVTLRELETCEENGPEHVQLCEAMDTTNAQFDDALNELWHNLMAQELHLHEAIEESTLNFEHRFTRLMSSFVEEAQLYFLQLRHVCEHFSDSITDAVSRFISTKLAQNDLDAVPQELRMCIDDRESLVNLVDAMKATHIARIEEREDRMATRSKEFISNYVEKLNKEEIERHRAKILEINSFMEMMRKAIANLPEEIHAELLSEQE